MPRRKRIENPLTEHITDYSDMEYDNNTSEAYIAEKRSKKRDQESFDDSDKSWMYDYKEKAVDDDCEDEDDDGFYNNDDSKPVAPSSGVPSNPVINKNIDKYMTAAVWFNEISKRGEMTADEVRYIELMIIEMSKFYFGNLKSLKPSKKCIEAMKEICSAVREAGICTG